MCGGGTKCWDRGGTNLVMSESNWRRWNKM